MKFNLGLDKGTHSITFSLSGKRKRFYLVRQMS